MQPHSSPVSVKTQCTFCYPHPHPPFPPLRLPLLTHAGPHILYHQGSTYSPQHQIWVPCTPRYTHAHLQKPLKNVLSHFSNFLGIKKATTNTNNECGNRCMDSFPCAYFYTVREHHHRLVHLLCPVLITDVSRFIPTTLTQIFPN